MCREDSFNVGIEIDGRLHMYTSYYKNLLLQIADMAISKVTLLPFFGLLAINILQAQESVNASGGDALGSGGTVAYSIGQAFYTTHTGSNGSVAQGVQQTYKISTVNIEEVLVTSSISVFPNPTTDNLVIEVDDFYNQKLSYQLVDIRGKFMSQGEILAKQNHINTISLPAATYFINIVNQKSKVVQSFEIIKK